LREPRQFGRQHAAFAQVNQHGLKVRQHGGASGARLLGRRQNVGHHDRDRACRMGRSDAGIGILDRDAGLWSQAKALSGEQIKVRARLAPCDVIAGQDRIETVSNAGKPEMLVCGVACGGGDDRFRQAARLDRIEQFDHAGLQRQSFRQQLGAFDTV
jgi:hypothetical protein